MRIHLINPSDPAKTLCGQRVANLSTATTMLARDLERFEGLRKEHRCRQCEKIGKVPGALRWADSPPYNAGRLEGHADVAAKLRAIVDPEDAEHLSLDGALRKVRELVAQAKKGSRP
jgi:hypothetical protein